MLDLDTPPARTRRRRRVDVTMTSLALASLLFLGATAAASAHGAAPAPIITVRAQWLPGSARLPTAAAWFPDGQRANLELNQPWTPDRPVRLVTAVAEVSCQIWVNGALVASDQATDYRYAVCSWTP